MNDWEAAGNAAHSNHHVRRASLNGPPRQLPQRRIQCIGHYDLEKVTKP